MILRHHGFSWKLPFLSSEFLNTKSNFLIAYLNITIRVWLFVSLYHFHVTSEFVCINNRLLHATVVVYFLICTSHYYYINLSLDPLLMNLLVNIMFDHIQEELIYDLPTPLSSSSIFGLLGCSIIPSSVIIPVMFSRGVTSNA